MIRFEQKRQESSSKLTQNKSDSFLKTKFLSQLVFVIFVLGACARAGMTVRSPAEIDTRTIRNVAVGKFEVGLIQEKIKTERNTVGAIAGSVPCSEYLVRRFADSGHLESVEDYNGWRIFPYPEQAVATLRELLVINIEVDRDR